MARVLGWLAHALDALWGERCPRCRMRVYRADLVAHEATQHAGDGLADTHQEDR